ncbi:MAG: cupin [Candidatus Limnocylindrales bacterium]
MAKLQRRSTTRADEVRSYAHGRVEVFDVGDFIVTRFMSEPGWRWSKSVKPIAGTDYCQFHHHGYTVSGRLPAGAGARRVSKDPAPSSGTAWLNGC